MTDNEIIKALECCWKNHQEDTCKYCVGHCPASDCDLTEDEDDCMDVLFGRAIDLIKRQQAEIEKKDRILESYALQYGTAVDKERIIKAEVEKLHPYKLHYGNLRMEIAREVCDRLYERAFCTTINDGGIECYTKVVSASEIYDLLEEMENEK